MCSWSKTRRVNGRIYMCCLRRALIKRRIYTTSVQWKIYRAIKATKSQIWRIRCKKCRCLSSTFARRPNQEKSSFSINTKTPRNFTRKARSSASSPPASNRNCARYLQTTQKLFLQSSKNKYCRILRGKCNILKALLRSNSRYLTNFLRLVCRDDFPTFLRWARWRRAVQSGWTSFWPIIMKVLGGTNEASRYQIPWSRRF
jgi:hypothetical protein